MVETAQKVRREQNRQDRNWSRRPKEAHHTQPRPAETERAVPEQAQSAPQTAAPAQGQDASRTREERRQKTAAAWDRAKEWTYLHLRRWAYLIQSAAGRRAVGPASFLVVSAALGGALTLTSLYTPSYAVTVNGQQVGVVADQEIVSDAIRQVEEEGASLLGYAYQVNGNVDYQFTLTLKSDLSSDIEIKNFFYGQLASATDHLRKCEVTVDGEVVGVVKDEETLNKMLDDLKSQYVTANTTEAGFVEDLRVGYVYAADELITVDEMRGALEANTTGETTYTVQKGDTFNAIAYTNDMSVSDLKALNPDVNINSLMIGQVLNVREEIPMLSVQTVEHQVYTQPIECPVEEKPDSSMYKGDSKILTKGEPGEARIEADVTFVNGYERDREVQSTTTVREPTTTVKAVGTKEKPKTASKGRFIWPISGRINSYFGGRYIFGSYSYHSGIDIRASYGATIKAADGGTVTYAGWKGSYGKLVIITHDNGTQTYYGHNSSLLVRAGEKVYQGQAIAKAGSTGRSTGNHCHFEVRVKGTAVNPLNYLR